jgi:soluble lytic murein transglycosylase
MKRLFGCLALTLWAASAVPIEREPLGSLARRFAESDLPADRDALVRFATEHKAAGEGALARLVIGVKDFQAQRLASAAEELAQAAAVPTTLTDYAVYYQALALAGQGDHAAAAARLADFASRFPDSPWREPGLRQRVESLSHSGQPTQALEIAPAPRNASGWALVARLAERADDGVRAARAWQRVYYEFPTASEQADAKTALAALREKLGKTYPAATPALRLGRADRLSAASQYLNARAEYRTLSTSLQGLPREQAAVRFGVADYNLKRTLIAYRWLRNLQVTQPEAAAERLFYQAAAARRLGWTDQFAKLVDELGSQHRDSPWYEEALFNAGNEYLLAHDADRYLKYYRSVYELFPRGRYAESAHWKVAWHAYQQRSDPEQAELARKLLEEHLRMFPASTQVTAAVYWLGRLAESRSDALTARAFYTHLTGHYPLYYHALLSRDRLAKLPAAAGPVSPGVMTLLQPLPPAGAPPSKEPSPEVRAYLDRAGLLMQLGLDDLAERELRFRADADRSAYHAGLELARLAASRGDYYRAVRLLKHYTPGYLAYSLDALPNQYWELLFPLPWRQQIERYARDNSLDPFLVAGLIRQESEFNPEAVSRAKAHGLMQLILPTGRLLARSAGLPPPTAVTLHRPETSLRLGTMHFKKVLDLYNGRLDFALAGYNAGEHRVDRWMDLYRSEDPDEFIENIPFTETRTYVQSVLRNAEIYRKLYGS